jgi:hypothetical protein
MRPERTPYLRMCFLHVGLLEVGAGVTVELFGGVVSSCFWVILSSCFWVILFDLGVWVVDFRG